MRVLITGITGMVGSHLADYILAEQPGVSPAAIGGGQTSWFSSGPIPTANRTLRPPEWLGGILLCVGVVFTFHALALSKPAG